MVLREHAQKAMSSLIFNYISVPYDYLYAQKTSKILGSSDAQNLILPPYMLFSCLHFEMYGA